MNLLKRASFGADCNLWVTGYSAEEQVHRDRPYKEP